METLFFTDSPEVKKILAKNRLSSFSLGDMKSNLESASEPALVYVDAGSWNGTPESLIAAVCRHKAVFVGIIDSSDRIKNPMPLMRKGLVDYISQKDMAADLNRIHCGKVLAYIKRFRRDFSETASPWKHKKEKSGGHVPVVRGWADVKVGKKCDFEIMFIEMDEREEMEKRYGSKNLHNALQVFRKYIERHVNAYGGKLWIWSRYGGVILFPFGANDASAVLCGFQMVMYKFLHDAEESHFPNFILFRIAEHIGSLVYQEKNKGEVVSDSLNTIFHLGQDFAEPGNFYLTGELFRYAPDAVKPYFKEAGSFEGRSIFRMRMPVL